MRAKRPPKETNQLAKYILEVTTGETEKIEPPQKNPHAQALSALGASKGGQAQRKPYPPPSAGPLPRKLLKVGGAENVALTLATFSVTICIPSLKASPQAKPEAIMPETNETMFLKELERYENKWVALVRTGEGETIVASGEDAAIAMRNAQEQGVNEPILYKVHSFDVGCIPTLKA